MDVLEAMAAGLPGAKAVIHPAQLQAYFDDRSRAHRRRTGTELRVPVVPVERLGASVTVLMGSDRNIKITKPSDLPLARLYLAQEKER